MGSNRYGRAVATNEYYIMKGRRITESIDQNLLNISKGGANEFKFWVQLTYDLMTFEDTEVFAVLCEKKIVEPCQYDSGGEGRLWGRIPAETYAKTIIIGVIEPKFGTVFAN